jgi:hypothetical protein
MINLTEIIQQLKPELYEQLKISLTESKGQKFLSLLVWLREDSFPEKEIAEKLGISQGAYYTLKSRLYTRINEFLLSGPQGSKKDMIQRVSQIPQLIYESPRETAIGILSKLEKDLANSDMPYELTNVYAALKKLHVSSPKYYEYEQLYNRHVAYSLALDKAEDVMAKFYALMNQYLCSRNPVHLERLPLLKKEMSNLGQLYESHHMTLYINLLNISFALYVPLPKVSEADPPVEDLLSESNKIISAYPHDTTYQYLQKVVTLLYFEYYHKVGQNKKCQQYINLINLELPGLLNYSFCCSPSLFLISKVEFYCLNGNENILQEENGTAFLDYTPNIDDVPGYLNYVKYHAACAFHSGAYKEASALLNNLMNTVSLKDYPHADIEVKLFFTLCLSMQKKYEHAHTSLRSVTRKIKESSGSLDYENAVLFSKILAMQMNTDYKGRLEKLSALRDKFILLNRGRTRLLEFINLSDDFLKLLDKA